MKLNFFILSVFCLLHCSAQNNIAENCITDKFLIRGDCYLCPLGWSGLNGRCFKYFPGPLAQRDAETNCQAEKSSLANANSDEKYNFIKSLVPKDGAFLSATATVPNSFSYADGSTSVFNWNRRDNWGGNSTFLNEGCVEIFKNGILNDVSCFATRAFICEMNLCPSTQYYDANSKDCADRKSLNAVCVSTDECNLKPGLICQSGKCSCPSFKYWIDGSCVSCPSGWTGLNGRCFKYFAGPLSQKISQTNCLAENSSLANANSDEKYNLIKTLVQKNGAFLSATATVPNSFSYADGSTSVFTWKNNDNWGGNSTFVNEGCVEIFKNGLLNDVSCFATRAYICEMNLCAPTQYYDTNKKYCTERKSLDATCLSTDECNLRPGLICQSGKCSCVSPLEYDTDAKKCKLNQVSSTPSTTTTTTPSSSSPTSTTPLDTTTTYSTTSSTTTSSISSTSIETATTTVINNMIRSIKTNDAVISLAVLPNGFLASGSADGTIKIWNTDDGSLVTNILAHIDGFITYSVKDLVVLQNGYLASGSFLDIKIWDTSNGTLIRILAGHTNGVSALAVLQNGNLISTGFDNDMKIWNTKDGELIQTITFGVLVLSFAVLPNGLLACGCEDKTVKILNTNYGGLIRIIEAHDDMVYALQVLKNGYLASAGFDSKIKIWSLDTGSLNRTLDANSAISLEILSNGYLASGNLDGTINIWNTDDGGLINTLSGHVGFVYALALLQNGFLASAGLDTTIKIWNTTSSSSIGLTSTPSTPIDTSTTTIASKMIKSINTTGQVISLAVLHNGYLAIGDGLGEIKIYNTNDEYSASRKISGHSKIVYSLAVLENGYLASGSGDSTIKIWNTDDASLVRDLTGHTDRVRTLVVLQNGLLASGSNDNSIKIWNASDASLKRTLEGHLNYVRALAVLPNGYLASGSNDKTIKIWSPVNGSLIKTLEGHSGFVTSLAVLKNGDLMSGSLDKTIKIWNTDTGSLVRTVQDNFIYSLAVLPDGSIASGSDESIQIWNKDDGSLITTLEGHTQIVWSLAVLKNGYLASGSFDNTIKIWN